MHIAEVGLGAWWLLVFLVKDAHVFTSEQLAAVAGESRFQHADASCVGADRDGRPCGYDAVHDA
jgi:hypothetical protein